jgi:hypothetical protein
MYCKLCVNYFRGQGFFTVNTCVSASSLESLHLEERNG